ncbi:hypothetical protein [Flavobacterium sp.]|uniref:hypothetical protein n=1 Tax=Flavobacterium sp. TaxID=239 RepID=UPI003750B8A2
MEKKKYLLLVLILSINFSIAQVGIGTTSPDAQLDIRSSNQVTPINTDGILIPKVDSFPVINPTIAQQSMLVYLTTATTFGGNPKAIGFYYWNNAPADWIGISSTINGDHDWYEEATTVAPNAITDDMFHTGNVAIGKNTTNYPLEINGAGFNRTLNVTTTNNVTDGVFNASFLNDYSGSSDDDVYVSRNTFSGASLGNVIGNSVQLSSSGINPFFGSYNVIANSSAGSHIAVQNSLGFSTNTNTGVRNLMQNITTNGSFTGVSNELYNNTGNGTTVGVNNLLGTSGTNPVTGTNTSIIGSGNGTQLGNYSSISNTGNGVHYGVQNNLSGTGTGIKYGDYNLINTAAGGTHYGVYSNVLKPGATNFAGYFLGNVGVGTTIANTYTLPPSRGTVGQTMRTDGAGNVTWANNSDYAWSTLGNAGTSIATNYFGTTDNNPIGIRTNALERMRILADGRVSINNTAPVVTDLLTVTTSGTLNYGINGYNNLTSGSAIYGINSNTANTYSGIEGATNSGIGAGILGTSYGTTAAGLTPTGIVGQYSGTSTNGVRYGVRGYSAQGGGNQQIGVQGSYNGGGFGIGVYGIGFGGGIVAGNNDIAVVGWRANNQNYSGYFNGNHVIANGTKTASVGTSKGNQLLYVTELPEVWFEDVGGGQLVNGSIHIQLDPMFIETIFVDESHPMRVFLQEEGESNGLIVIKDADNKGFTVKEKNGGTSNITFSFRIMAKRLHFQDHRFGNDPLWGEGDTRQYNQYATPPPVDYTQNVKFQEEQKRNYKPTPMPKGFIDYFQLQENAIKIESKKENLK